LVAGGVLTADPADAAGNSDIRINSSATSGRGQTIISDDLTTGHALRISSNSNSTGNRNLVYIENTNTLATNAVPLTVKNRATGEIAVFKNDSKNVLQVRDDGIIIGQSTTQKGMLHVYNQDDTQEASIVINAANSASGATRDPQIKLAIDGTTEFTIGVDDSDGDNFKIGTTALDVNSGFAINDSGQVGIGSVNSAAFPLNIPLTVSGSDSELIRLLANGEDKGVDIGCINNGTFEIRPSTGQVTIKALGSDDSYLAFDVSGINAWCIGTDDSDADKFKIGTTALDTNTAITIDRTTRNVGIGTTVPTSKLHIDSDRTSEPALKIESAAAGTPAVKVLGYSTTTAATVDIQSTALTSGNALKVESQSGDTAAKSIVYIKQQALGASNSTALEVRNRATATTAKVASFWADTNLIVAIDNTTLSIANSLKPIDTSLPISIDGHRNYMQWKCSISDADNQTEKVVRTAPDVGDTAFSGITVPAQWLYCWIAPADGYIEAVHALADHNYGSLAGNIDSTIKWYRLDEAVISAVDSGDLLDTATEPMNYNTSLSFALKNRAGKPRKFEFGKSTCSFSAGDKLWMTFAAGSNSFYNSLGLGQTSNNDMVFQIIYVLEESTML